MSHELWLEMLRHGAPLEQVHYQPARPGDLYLLRSDGLTRQMPDEAIRAIVAAEERDLATCCRRLVEAADRARGSDNVTVLLVRLCA